MSLVDKFLCHFELETGGKVVGVYEIIFSTIYGIQLIVQLLTNTCNRRHTNLKFFENIYELAGQNSDEICTKFKIDASIIILLYITSIAIYLLLILGTIKRKHNWLKPYFVFEIIYGIIYIINCIMIGTPIRLALCFFYIIVVGYTLACIYSLYVKIRDENEDSSARNGQAQRLNKEQI